MSDPILVSAVQRIPTNTGSARVGPGTEEQLGPGCLTDPPVDKKDATTSGVCHTQTLG